MPKVTVPERNKAFVTRILWDFAHQWRHILRSDYNIHTFRRLACAIVRIATMDFRVVEVDTPRQGKGGHLVSVFRLPPWEPFDTDLLWIRSTRIVLTQDLDSAISLIRKDSASSSVAGNAAEKTPAHQLSYLVLSVRYIVLCRVVNNILEYSKPEPFLNGIDPPSKMAVRLLLLATAPHYQPTPLHDLPVEIQDMILHRVSVGPVEGAKAGCLLGLGAPFSWRSGNRNLEREEGHCNRTAWSPVEQQIWFGDYHSGVVYK